MRVVITGREGQVARALAERAHAHDATVVFVGRPGCDLALPETIAPALVATRPDVIVSAAAYTAVDQAESEPDLAMAINGHAAGVVAAAASEIGVPLVHLSTDYVFDGASERPYRADDPVGPVSVYGRSKLMGEQAVAAACLNHAILRTAWVYSPFGKNFVKTMLRLARTHDLVRVVSDQQGAPTSALDIADGVLQVAANLLDHPQDQSLRGTFHMTGQGETSWAGLAERIFATSQALGGPTARVEPISTQDYPTPARRPANSRLDCSRLKAAHAVALPPWQDSVDACVARLLETQDF